MAEFEASVAPIHHSLIVSMLERKKESTIGKVEVVVVAVVE